MKPIGVAIIGCGGVTLQNHIPGLAICREAKLVALCDTDAATLNRAAQQTGVTEQSSNYEEILARDDVHAVVIATPNVTHAPIALAAIARGKHVLCEKPLAMDFRQSMEMFRAADKAGVRHMTAFTYRFVPAMRYMTHLMRTGAVGRPWHFRAQRFQDWSERSVGWRQIAKLCATGELGDMLSHRLDYAHFLIGEMSRLVARTRRYVDTRQGLASDVDDWVAILADFENGATGVFESTKLATGRGEGGRSRDYCEINGDEGTLVFHLERPLELQIGKRGDSELKTVPLPEEFLKLPASPRDPRQGDPLLTFRYDQMVEFIDAIVHQRPCVPSFYDGARAQAVMEAAVESDRTGRWIDVPQS
jgi:predicted dehydrogenase